MSAERTNEIEEAASDWLIRRDSGAWSAEDQARLMEWLNASTLHRVAFLRLERTWEEAARLKALGAGIPGDRPPEPGHWTLTPFFDFHPAAAKDAQACTEPDGLPPASVNSRPRETSGNELNSPETSAPSGQIALPREFGETGAFNELGNFTHGVNRRSAAGFIARSGFGKRRRLSVAAATVLFAAVVGTYLLFAPRGDRYSTPVGGFASVPMADGSRVMLNTDSQIRIALSKTERRVDLKHGEAYFEVYKDPNRPFVVRAGSRLVTAVGTKFSVRREGDDVEVVVTEGKVRIADGAVGRPLVADGSAAVFLTPGSIARMGNAGALVQEKTVAEAEEQLSWRAGVLMFRNQTLREAVAEFNRYNERQIVIQDPAVAELKIEGNFRITNVEAFVRLLETGFPIRAEQQPKTIVLLSK